MDKIIIKTELQFKTSRSSGAGGQNVNKVETKVELLFDINASKGFDEGEKNLILTKLEDKISKDGLLHISSQISRSQLSNKEDAEKKLFSMLKEALKVEKIRKKTMMPRAVVASIKKTKSIRSDVKAMRKRPSMHTSDDI